MTDLTLIPSVPYKVIISSGNVHITSMMNYRFTKNNIQNIRASLIRNGVKAGFDLSAKSLSFELYGSTTSAEILKVVQKIAPCTLTHEQLLSNDSAIISELNQNEVENAVITNDFASQWIDKNLHGEVMDNIDKKQLTSYLTGEFFTISSLKELTQQILDDAGVAYMNVGHKIYHLRTLKLRCLTDLLNNKANNKVTALNDMKEADYISYIDDPRITLDVALEMEKLKDDEFFTLEDVTDWSSEYFEKHFTETPESILFPIKREYQLRERCFEILSYVKGFDAEYFSWDHFLSALFKNSLKKVSCRIEHQSDSWGKYGNPELQMAFRAHKSIFNHSGVTEFFKEKILLSKELVTPENNHETLRQQMEGFVAGIIWTQSNIGRSVHEVAYREAGKIQDEILTSKMPFKVKK